MNALRKKAHLVKCVHCGKLIAADTPQEACSACLVKAEGEEQPTQPAPALPESPSTGAQICSHCGQAPVLENADRCNSCQWELYNGMNGAIAGLRERASQPSLEGRTQHLLETLAKKRDRAATNRINFVTMKRLR